MFPFRRRPWRPNWWTIAPVLASVALWSAIGYVGLRTKSALDDKAERVAYAAASEEAEAASRKQSERPACPQPGCDPASAKAPGAEAARNH